MSTEVNYRPELDSIHREMRDMKTLMSSMVEAMGRITIIEERQHAHASVNEKISEQLGQLVAAQHQIELVNATNSTIATRVSDLEVATRESHVRYEKDRARFDTVVTMVKMMWAVISIFGVSGIGYFLVRIAQMGVPGIV